jgi:hypothetical protein
MVTGVPDIKRSIVMIRKSTHVLLEDSSVRLSIIILGYERATFFSVNLLRLAVLQHK